MTLELEWICFLSRSANSNSTPIDFMRRTLCRAKRRQRWLENNACTCYCRTTPYTLECVCNRSLSVYLGERNGERATKKKRSLLTGEIEEDITMFLKDNRMYSSKNATSIDTCIESFECSGHVCFGRTCLFAKRATNASTSQSLNERNGVENDVDQTQSWSFEIKNCWKGGALSNRMLIYEFHHQ